MEVEPTKAEPPKRKRRWFQFSLRTLLIGVALVPASAIAGHKAVHSWRIDVLAKNRADVDEGRRASRYTVVGRRSHDVRSYASSHRRAVQLITANIALNPLNHSSDDQFALARLRRRMT